MKIVKKITRILLFVFDSWPSSTTIPKKDEIDIDDNSEEEETQTLKGWNWYPSKLKVVFC